MKVITEARKERRNGLRREGEIRNGTVRDKERERASTSMRERDSKDRDRKKGTESQRVKESCHGYTLKAPPHNMVTIY